MDLRQIAQIELQTLLAWGGTTVSAAALAGFGLAKYVASTQINGLQNQLKSIQTHYNANVDALQTRLKDASDRISELRPAGNERDSLREEVGTLRATIANKDQRIKDLEALQGQAPDGQVAELRNQLQKLEELRAALLGGEEEAWKLRGAPLDPALAEALRKSRVRVLTVANLKGGVGKTTITINLAAYFALAMELRVLIIDFDYQGSLTATALNAAKQQLGSNILADSALGGDVTGRWMTEVPRDLSKVLPNVRLITNGGIFDRFENQTMMRWLIGDINDDVRYRLTKLILTPEVQEAYDLILIDAPPRTSLGAVNALCASHALLVPTVPDSLSVDAVGRFLARMSKLRSIMPALTDALIIPSLTEESELKPAEEDALTEAKTYLSNWSGGAFVTEAFIRHFTTLARTAGREIAYLSDKRFVRPAFDALGAEIASRLNLVGKGT